MFLATSSEDGTIRLWGAKPQTGPPAELSEKPTEIQTTLEKWLGIRYCMHFYFSSRFLVVLIVIIVINKSHLIKQTNGVLQAIKKTFKN